MALTTTTLKGAAVGALATVLAACGGGDGTTGQDATPTVELALVASGDTDAAFRAQVKRFNSSSEDITLKLRTYPSGEAYEQALTGQVAGGQAPDIFLLDAGVKTREYADAGAIMELNSLVEDAGIEISEFEENLVEAGSVDGKLFAVPKDYSTTALFYRKSMLDEAGVEPPTTWEGLRSAADELTTEDRFGLGMYPQLNYFLAWIQSAGGNFVTESGVENVANPGHEKAVDLLLTMFAEDKSAASPTMTGASWDGEMLANGQVAMVFGGTWIPAGVPDEIRNDIGVTPLPASEQEGAVLYAAGWAISAKSENPEAAAEVISFLTSDEELVAGHEDGIILLPPKPSALEELASREEDPVLDVAQESAATGVPFGYLAPETVDSYNAALERLIAKPGSMTAADAVEQLAGELE